MSKKYMYVCRVLNNSGTWLKVTLYSLRTFIEPVPASVIYLVNIVIECFFLIDNPLRSNIQPYLMYQFLSLYILHVHNKVEYVN